MNHYYTLLMLICFLGAMRGMDNKVKKKSVAQMVQEDIKSERKIKAILDIGLKMYKKEQEKKDKEDRFVQQFFEENVEEEQNKNKTN